MYLFLIVLDLIVIILILLLGSVLAYFVNKIFDKSISFSKTLSIILLYFIFSALIYWILNLVFASSTANNIIKLVLGLGVTFAFIFILWKKYFSFTLGKTFVVYLTLIVLIPVISFYLFMIQLNIINLQLFDKSSPQYQNLSEEQTFSQVLSVVKKDMFLFPAEYIKEIIILRSF